MSTLKDSEKTSDKLQHFIMTKTVNKVRIEELSQLV